MRKPFRIVIAEDELLVAEMIEGMLHELGHTVIGRAVSGVQAVELARQLQPTALLMDIHMPEMDGLQAARDITATCPVPIVVLTAFETPELVEQAGAAGVGAYLTKPPNAREMERALTIAVARFDDMMTLRRINDELRAALQTVKTLSGLLPVCSYCKKIRDDKGHWHHIEEYIQNHSDAAFTHGICPQCEERVYAEFPKERDE